MHFTFETISIDTAFASTSARILDKTTSIQKPGKKLDKTANKILAQILLVTLSRCDGEGRCKQVCTQLYAQLYSCRQIPWLLCSQTILWHISKLRTLLIDTVCNIFYIAHPLLFCRLITSMDLQIILLIVSSGTCVTAGNDI